MHSGITFIVVTILVLLSCCHSSAAAATDDATSCSSNHTQCTSASAPVCTNNNECASCLACHLSTKDLATNVDPATNSGPHTSYNYRCPTDCCGWSSLNTNRGVYDEGERRIYYFPSNIIYAPCESTATVAAYYKLGDQVDSTSIVDVESSGSGWIECREDKYGPGQGALPVWDIKCSGTSIACEANRFTYASIIYNSSGKFWFTSPIYAENDKTGQEHCPNSFGSILLVIIIVPVCVGIFAFACVVYCCFFRGKPENDSEADPNYEPMNFDNPYSIEAERTKAPNARAGDEAELRDQGSIQEQDQRNEGEQQV